MQRFPDVVRAPPEAVWGVLVEPALRSGWAPLITEAALESGVPGQPGSVARYATKRKAWREVLIESDPPRRLVLEIRDEKAEGPSATWLWRLEAIEMGTLVVLEVQAKTWGGRFANAWWRKRWHRRLVERVKNASEAGGVPTVPRVSEEAPSIRAERPRPASHERRVAQKARKVGRRRGAKPGA